MARTLTLSALLVFGLILVLVFMNRRLIIGYWTYGGQARDGSLRVGDVAPIVEAWQLDGLSKISLVDSSEAKPTVLVFGSFT